MTTATTPVTGADRAVNGAVRWLADRGVGLAGARTLTVRGRRTGRPHRIPVNPLDYVGERYLVAPRGVTDWVRNVRTEPRAELRRGRRREAVVLDEVRDADVAVPVLSAYLARWGWEVGRLLPEPLTPESDAADLRAHARLLPVFRVIPG